MASDLILNPAQAQAVYSAMCALNVIGDAAKVHARFPVDGGMLHVVERNDGEIEAWIAGSGEVETHDNQAAFAAAYDLPVAAPNLAAALRVAYSDIQRLPGHTIDMLGRIEAALELSPA
ncbi:hypothetical protein LMG26841_05168 [Achromobacter dolens]|uniref:Uncharacterized protein n=1 Tax=Achromobacter dolens TaxID=1287738 RepID=A0A6S7ELI2_9BURK|nr:hypothetical protein [Achromobacter dolens]CAB3914372.1 hypothetical protein LMG26841_05168 [Achromobacter dolens]